MMIIFFCCSNTSTFLRISMSTQIDKPRGSVASLLEKFSQADESSKQAKIRDERMSSVRTSVGKRVSDRVSSGPWTSSSIVLTSNGACRPSLNDNNILPVQSGPEPKKPLKDWLSVPPMITGRKSPSEVISGDLERIWGAKIAGVQAEDSKEKPLLDDQAVPLMGAIKPSSPLPSQQDQTDTDQHTIDPEPKKRGPSLDSPSVQSFSAVSIAPSCPPGGANSSDDEPSPSVTSNQPATSTSNAPEKSETVYDLRVSPDLTPAKKTVSKSVRTVDSSLNNSRSSVSAAPLPQKSSTSSAASTTSRKPHLYTTPSKTEDSSSRPRMSTAERSQIVTSSQRSGTEVSVRKNTSSQATTPRTTIISSTSRLYSPTASSLAKAKNHTLSPSSSSSTTIQKSPLSASRTSLQGEFKAASSPSVDSRPIRTSPIGPIPKPTFVSNKQPVRGKNTPSNSRSTSKRPSTKPSVMPSRQTSRSSQSSPNTKLLDPKQSPESAAVSHTRVSSRSKNLNVKTQPVIDQDLLKDVMKGGLVEVAKDDAFVSRLTETEIEADQTEKERF